MVQTVCLDAQKHAAAMLKKLQKMKSEANLCDFIIKVNNKEFCTHKNILAAGSNYFEAMFSHDTEETRNGVIVMKEVDEDCVKSCVDFIYSGKFDIPDNKIGQLLHVVIMLQLDDMKVAITGILDQSLCADNFYSTKDIANFYRLNDIARKCNEFYEENFVILSLQPEFKTEKISRLRDVVTLNMVDLSEDEKLSICLRWAGDSVENRKGLIELIQSLNLWKLSREYLSDLLENDPVVSNDLQLYKTLSNPMLKPNTSVQSPVKEKEETTKGEKKKKKVEKSKESIILFDENADNLQSYNPISGSVTRFHNENFKQLGKFTATVLESYIYVLCSNKAVYRLNFQYLNSKWEKMPDTIHDHGRSPSQIASSGFLYVVGGLDNNYKAMKAVERFEPKNNVWVAMEDKPDPIALSTLVTLGEFVYSVGGYAQRGADSRLFSRFTPLHDHWTTLPEMRSARSYCGAVAVGYKIYAMGGMRNSSSLKTCECFDTAAAQWTTLKPMLKRHDAVKAYYADGHIFAVCDGNSDESEKYDIEEEKWSKITMTGLGRFQICTSVSTSS